MTTLESPYIAELFDRVHRFDHGIKMGGSVPNLQTELPQSYHRSWDDTTPGNRRSNCYSTHYWGDRHLLGKSTRLPNGHHDKPERFACAIDFTMDAERMHKYGTRIKRWCEGYDGHKPKSKELSFGYNILTVREITACLDGTTVLAWDTTTLHPYRTFGWDISHRWHIHVSINRRLILSPELMSIANFFRN